MAEEDKKNADLICMCPQCGLDWVLTQEERIRFISKGLHLPKRCHACRMDKEKQDQQRS